MTERDWTADLSWSARAVATWTRCYTLGLPEDLRHDRRDELTSDLWEHAGDSRSNAAPEILTRGLLGVPADLAWRLEHSRLARLPGSVVGVIFALLGRLDATGRWLNRRGLPGFTTATAVVVGLLGALVIVTAPINDSATATRDLVWWGALLITGALLVGLGGRVIAGHARLGGVAVILGSGLVGLLLWPTVVGPIAALALSWRAAIRIRNDRRLRRSVHSS